MLRNLARKSRTLVRQPASVVKTRILLSLCTNIGRPANYQRCSFICKQPWNGDFVRRYRRARRFRAAVDPEAVGVIRVLSYSRSGSHNFLARLHYVPSCFVLKENLCADKATDPSWRSLSPGDITAADYMGFSLFGLHGLQRKDGADLAHLVAPFNKLLEFPLDPQEGPFAKPDRVLFLVRNFFRMLMSRQTAVERQGKSKWEISDDAFYEAADAHHRNVKAYRTLMAAEPERFHILGHEIFCARPEAVFCETTEKLGVANGAWVDPEAFFVGCLDGRTKPVVRDNMLWDTTIGAPILGTGGGFNPRMEPSLERTLGGDVGSFVKKEWADYARRLFGEGLVDLWLSDTPATYESMSTEEYVRLLYQGL